MAMLHRIIVITLISSSHISLCAGSLLSVGMAFASHMATSEQGVMMTRDTRPPLCMLMTPNVAAKDSAEASPCEGGRKCSGTPLALSLSPSQSAVHHAAFATLPFIFLYTEGRTNFLHDAVHSKKPPGKTGGLLIASVVRRE
jgi:hypothetical protein